MATIPTKLKDVASELGCNVINYVTTTKEGEVFSLAATDSNGDYLPIGQPMLYAVKGSMVEELPPFQADEILSNIKD